MYSTFSMLRILPVFASAREPWSSRSFTLDLPERDERDQPGWGEGVGCPRDARGVFWYISLKNVRTRYFLFLIKNSWPGPGI